MMSVVTVAQHHPSSSEPNPGPTCGAVWTPAQRGLFRFMFCYLGLYNFPFPLGLIPGADRGQVIYSALWAKLVPWFAMRVLNMSRPVMPLQTGSGDTTFRWVQTCCVAALALLASLVWTVLARRPLNHRGLNAWFQVYLSLSLGCALMNYAAVKLFGVQFPFPRLETLMETYGQSSPMRLLWTFMGISRQYEIFTGTIELLGGILVCLPRTRTLGALICAGAMANVFVLNMSYDVPVKLYSLHLLVMSVVLLLPALRPLIDFLVLGRASKLSTVESLLHSPRFTRAWPAMLLVFTLAACSVIFVRAYKNMNIYTEASRRPPLYGIWTVTQPHSATGDATSDLLWRLFIVDDADSAMIQDVEGRREVYAMRFDAREKTVILRKYDGSGWISKFQVYQPSPSVLVLDGRYGAAPAHVEMQRLNEQRLLLVSRGFHWINEYPPNR
jgi:hypothetical protein